MPQWVYKLYKFRFEYTVDKEIMFVFVDINKPEKVLTADEQAELTAFISALHVKGYDVIVRD